MEYEIYRIDNTLPPSAYPYRVRVDGEIQRNDDGQVRKFRTLNEAKTWLEKDQTR